MADQAREQITVNAPVEACFAVLLDLEDYPSWVRDLKEVTVIDRDDQGRGAVVEFRVAGLGRPVTYRLRYDYSGAPHQLGWSLVEGDLPRAIDGAYHLAPAADDPQRTEVSYELAIDLSMPIPGFVKRRAEDRIIKSALSAFRDRVESTSA